LKYFSHPNLIKGLETWTKIILNEFITPHLS
jgi:hypothetical protein